MKTRNLLVLMFVMAFSFITVAVSNQEVLAQEESLIYDNDVLGITVEYPVGYQIIEQQYLSDIYGFSITNSEKEPIFDIGWVHNGDSKQQDIFVMKTIEDFSTISISQSAVQVDGQEGVLLAPIPGVETNTLIYVSANERLYTLRFYKESLDDLGWSILNSIRFYPARESLNKLNLVYADDALYIPKELEDELKPITPEKSPLSELTIDENTSLPNQTRSLASGCTTSSSVQTQWGAGANSSSGWSWAGPSYWGNGSHLDCNSTTSYNDYYALDHALNEWDVIYPHKSGRVIFSGWAGGGWSTLGRMVIIDYGYGYWGVMAHMRYISSLGSVGSYVNENTIIGYAGGSGNNQDNYYGIHLHQSLNKNAILSTNPGGIYGGQSARPYGYKYSSSGGGTYLYSNMYPSKVMSY